MTAKRKQAPVATQSEPAWPASEIVRQPIDALIPYARNARTHSDAQVAQIAASIREWGWTNPILIDETGGIIAGHGRVMAARKLGIGEVPCIVARGWSEAQRRAYVLADNQLALNAGWDVDLLNIELLDLKAAGFGLELIGFEADALAALLRVPDELGAMPNLPDGDKPPFQQMTFTLHDEQAEAVKAALDAAKSLGAFVETGNDNSNGNALARICETFLSRVS